MFPTNNWSCVSAYTFADITIPRIYPSGFRFYKISYPYFLLFFFLSCQGNKVGFPFHILPISFCYFTQTAYAQIFIHQNKAKISAFRLFCPPISKIFLQMNLGYILHLINSRQCCPDRHNRNNLNTARYIIIAILSSTKTAMHLHFPFLFAIIYGSRIHLAETIRFFYPILHLHKQHG